MNGDVSIEGLKEILGGLDRLKTSGANRVLKAALKGGLKVIGDQMKKDVDQKVKTGRSSVKSRIIDRRGTITAKVGFGVGKRKKRTKAKPIGVLNRKGNRKSGVGIGPNNIAWWVAGTKERFTGSRKSGKGRRLTGNPHLARGRMPSMQPRLAWLAAQKSRGKVVAEMIRRGALQLKKEYDKLG